LDGFKLQARERRVAVLNSKRRRRKTGGTVGKALEGKVKKKKLQEDKAF